MDYSYIIWNIVYIFNTIETHSKTPLKRMKKLKPIFFSLILLLSVRGLSQDYTYLRLQVDVNNALGIIDNPRTDPEILGLDFDIEAGARYKSIGVYITYGRFNAQGYQNYAAGVDYYLPISKLTLAAGINYGQVLRRSVPFYVPSLEPVPSPRWKSRGAIAARGVMLYAITKRLQAVSTLQLQQRQELDKFVLEGAAGLQYSF